MIDENMLNSLPYLLQGMSRRGETYDLKRSQVTLYVDGSVAVHYVRCPGPDCNCDLCRMNRVRP